MSEIHYLGATNNRQQKHVPGSFVLTKSLDQYTEGEMDLLLTRQRLEIEKMNSAAVAGPFNYQQDNYDEALKVVNHALANISNPEHLHAIGEVLIGKAKKKGGKTGAGRFLQKIAKGVKKGVKAVSKVVTAPLRLIGKGAMELYLPKAAPAFLYLFAEENVLPDKMRVKRKKADKFKKFVVKMLGMKEKHFMAIIRNKLTKNYGRSPESFLADAIKKIAAAPHINGIGKTPMVNKQKSKPKAKPQGLKINRGSAQKIFEAGINVPQNVQDANYEMQASQGNREAERKKNNKQAALELGKGVATSLASGNPIGAIMAAINWLIGKLGGKKEGISFDANDVPDLAGDSGNAFKFDELKENYESITPYQREQIKEVATNLIENDVTGSNAQQQIIRKLPYLNPNQVKEITGEVNEGFEPVTEEDGRKISTAIKSQYGDGENLDLLEKTGGGTSAGACSC
ncbi:MAG: hypothetical protein H7320_13090 [Ferruginibacter sp.]|nr:hypothetical protein [Ferruginibacter sp.]